MWRNFAEKKLQKVLFHKKIIKLFLTWAFIWKDCICGHDTIYLLWRYIWNYVKMMIRHHRLVNDLIFSTSEWNGRERVRYITKFTKSSGPVLSRLTGCAWFLRDEKAVEFKMELRRNLWAGHLLRGCKHAIPVKSLPTRMYLTFWIRASLTLQPPNYSFWIFTHLKLCLADAIHNFKWVKIIPIRQTHFKSCWLMMLHFIINIFKMWYLMCW